MSWLPGQILTRNSAVTAMILADTTVGRDIRESHRNWPYIQGWAAELGLTAPEAIARTSQPTVGISPRQDPGSRQPEHEAAG